MKTIYFMEMEDCQFFFDSKKKLITHWYRNDAQYSGGYMKELFLFLKINVKTAPKAEPFLAQAKKILYDDGFLEYET